MSADGSLARTVPQWLDILAEGQARMNAGDAVTASAIFRASLIDFADNSTAVDWLKFNLMQSECQVSGLAAARVFMEDLLSSSINWSAKLYVVELVLSSLVEEDSAGPEVISLAAQTLAEWQWRPHEGDPINIISCQGLVRHLRRAFPAQPLPIAFETEDHENLYPVVKAWHGAPTSPTRDISCNRWPRALRAAQAAGIPPTRPMGFRHVGRAFILRDGDNTIIFDDAGRVLDTPYGPLPRFLREALEQGRPHLKTAKRIQGTALFVGDFFSQAVNYCHWMLDSMPRIVAARDVGLGFDHVIGAFVETEAFQTWSLERLLEGKENYLAISASDGLIEVENLFFSDNCAIEHLWHPANAADVALLNALRNRLSRPHINAGRRLYVPRRHSRVVINESALLGLLTSYGFETVEMDGLSPDRQAEIFAGAEAVVAPHGAALTNLLFAPKTTKVLEFFPAFGGSASFYRLTTALGMDYSCLIDDISHGPDRDETEIPLNNKSGIMVELNFVEEWLRTRLKANHPQQSYAQHFRSDLRH